MKCPSCKTTITKKHYDPEYEWYECPSCDGAFQESELESSRAPVKADRGASAKKRPVAKAKARKAAREADDELAERMTEEVAKATKTTGEPKATKHRDQVRTKEVVNIMGDELQEIYHERGLKLDEINAQDKALTIFRAASLEAFGVAGFNGTRETSYDVPLCREHREAA